MFVLLLPRLLHRQTRVFDVHVFFSLLRETVLLLLKILLALLMLLRRDTFQLLQFLLTMHTILLLAKVNKIAFPIAVALMMRRRGRNRQSMFSLHRHAMLFLQPYLLVAKRPVVVATVGSHQAIRHRLAETFVAAAARCSRMTVWMWHRKTGLLHCYIYQT